MNVITEQSIGQRPQSSHRTSIRGAILFLVVMIRAGLIGPALAHAEQLSAGVAKVDITQREAGPVNDPLYVKALVVKSEKTTVALITLDAVAIGEIGYIKNDFLPKVRARLQEELGIPPANVLVNASHCHGVVRANSDELTVQAVKMAAQNLVPVRVGSGVGVESRIMENRRLKLKSGKEADVRYAYSLPPDEEVVEVGPVDPQIGVLRFDRHDGRTLAVLYNFACHPIIGVPSGGNSADLVGFASQVIEENLNEGTLALFFQGCGGDINPARYKDVDHPRNAEPLGNMLGLSALKAIRKIECRHEAPFRVVHEIIALPRGDRTERIFALEAEQKRLLQSLKGTNLNLKAFIPLVVKYNVSGDFPSYYSHRYLQEKALGQLDLHKLDTDNRRHMNEYMQNIHIMEELTRLQTNLDLLKKHQASLVASGKRTIDVELSAVRLGDFVLTTFPGELTTQIGLNIKKRSPHPRTFVAGYTNGYIYYAPTADQLRNVGGAQEDSDCVLAPEWQQIYEDKVGEMLKKL